LMTLRSTKLRSRTQGVPLRGAAARSSCTISHRSSMFVRGTSLTVRMSCRSRLSGTRRRRKSNQSGRGDRLGQGGKKRTLRRCYSCRKRRIRSRLENTVRKSRKERNRSSDLLHSSIMSEIL
jgi:hypothetical protein